MAVGSAQCAEAPSGARPSTTAEGAIQRRTRVTFYRSTTHRKRRPCFGTNDVVLRTDTGDAVVIKTVGEVLDSRVIEKSIELAINRTTGVITLRPSASA